MSRPPAATQALKYASPQGALEEEEEEHRLKKRPIGDWNNQRKIECYVVDVDVTASVMALAQMQVYASKICACSNRIIP